MSRTRNREASIARRPSLALDAAIRPVVVPTVPTRILADAHGINPSSARSSQVIVDVEYPPTLPEEQGVRVGTIDLLPLFQLVYLRLSLVQMRIVVWDFVYRRYFYLRKPISSKAQGMSPPRRSDSVEYGQRECQGEGEENRNNKWYRGGQPHDTKNERAE